MTGRGETSRPTSPSNPRVPQKWIWRFMIVASALIAVTLIAFFAAWALGANRNTLVWLAMAQATSWLLLAVAGVANLLTGGHRAR